MADAAYQLTARRPEDPNWDDRGHEVQQYELRVERLDERFGKRIDELFAKAVKAGKWRGTRAIHDPAVLLVRRSAGVFRRGWSGRCAGRFGPSDSHA